MDYDSSCPNKQTNKQTNKKPQMIIEFNNVLKGHCLCSRCLDIIQSYVRNLKAISNNLIIL